jgi:NADPH-dependent curcumin reductase CurA
MSPLPKTYKRVYLAERPKDGPLPALTFTPESLPLSTPKSSDEVLVKVEYVSLDPAMRGWLKDVRSYVPPVKIGETMRAGGLGRVIIGGKTLKFGDLVFGNLGMFEPCFEPLFAS